MTDTLARPAHRGGVVGDQPGRLDPAAPVDLAPAGLSAVEVLAAVVARRRAADTAEADLLALVAHLMGLHPAGADEAPAGTWITGAGALLFPPGWLPAAGEGTPQVAEHAVAELGAALGISYPAALTVVGDTLELRYRLPRLWALVQAGCLQAWKARRVARATMSLSPVTARYVDAQLAVTGRRNQIPSNLGAVIHQALMVCEPETAEGREESALAARDVSFDFGRSSATCATATMTATLDTLDALDLENTISDIATAMGRLGDDSDAGVRRAHALGMLADPQHTLDVFGPLAATLLETDSDAPTDAADQGRTQDVDAATTTTGTAATGVEADAAAAAAATSSHPTESDARAAGFATPTDDTAGDHGAGAGEIRRRVNATRATVYLHIGINDLRDAAHQTDRASQPGKPGRPAEHRLGTGAGGRVERLGTATLDLLRDWLGGAGAVTIRPVLDANRSDRIDGHDPTDAMRETVILRDGHCVFPGCGIDARACDQDHTVPFVPLDRGGRPGQTSVDALACLCRRHHRLKTFTAWDYHRLPDGDYAWTSPSGHAYTGHPDPKR